MRRITVTLITLITIAAGLLCLTGQFGRTHFEPAAVALPPPRPTPPADSAALRRIREHLDYFLRTHDVQDEGYNMVAEYAASLSRSPKPRAQTEVFIAYKSGIWKDGRWQKIPKQGYGIATDHSGRLMSALWRADTVVQATVCDTAGVYRGELGPLLEPQGHGSFTAADGTYYEGRWSGGQRNGFGFSVSKQGIRAGEWTDNLYKGERLEYTSERIYGIDISRYQHGRGRRYYPINWDRLRITHLGSLSRKRIRGACDFPVSFVFIKSTEGTSIRNPYYMRDYLAARSRGLRTGAYHFFSLKTSGEQQARHFVHNTLFRRGDLPPVLDIEPTDAQIRSIGGPAALFRRVRAWLSYVERYTGTRPILYLSQTFVSKHLPAAPDLKERYDVWIARYGEYKPDVRLAVWQLSPDGRVQGIHGDVDINVFNGYRAQYNAFLSSRCVR